MAKYNFKSDREAKEFMRSITKDPGFKQLSMALSSEVPRANKIKNLSAKGLYDVAINELIDKDTLQTIIDKTNSLLVSKIKDAEYQLKAICTGTTLTCQEYFDAIDIHPEDYNLSARTLIEILDYHLKGKGIRVEYTMPASDTFDFNTNRSIPGSPAKITFDWTINN